jgi:hypothetical protein
MIENWKSIKDYPKYSVSDLGRVRRDHVLKPSRTGGYEEVVLHDAPRKKVYKYIHILVLSTFKPNSLPDLYDCVDHINRNTYDNRLVNLRWSNATLNGLNSNAIGYCFDKHANKFKAQLMQNGVNKHLGLYKYSVDARRAYKKAKKEAFKNLDPDQEYEV